MCVLPAGIISGNERVCVRDVYMYLPGHEV